MVPFLFRSLLALLALAATPCHADSWAAPQAETYESPDKTYRLRVAPREIASALAYFSDKVKKREPAGGAKGQQQARATATIEHVGADGVWVALWSGLLTNEVAPVDALITDGRRYVVTFDNWHSMGYGPNVVAIHDGHGRLIRALTLNDIVSEDYIFALRHSVSSIWWRGDPRLEPADDTLMIPIVVPGDRQDADGETYVDAVIRLSDGAVLSGASPEWKNAQAAAAKEAQSQRDYNEKAKQAFIAPLLGPTENGIRLAPLSRRGVLPIRASLERGLSSKHGAARSGCSRLCGFRRLDAQRFARAGPFQWPDEFCQHRPFRPFRGAHGNHFGRGEAR